MDFLHIKTELVQSLDNSVQVADSRYTNMHGMLPSVTSCDFPATCCPSHVRFEETVHCMNQLVRIQSNRQRSLVWTATVVQGFHSIVFNTLKSDSGAYPFIVHDNIL